MSQQLRHRGPDDDGLFCAGPVAFGFRRLSIIDVAGGHQPLSNEDDSVWCMLNGEIYNYVELRNELEQLGHQLKTRSDTETIVHAYEEHGIDFLSRLQGMFAIALWDAKRRQLVLARDRVGKKPLYFSSAKGQLAFASEMKALLPWPSLDRSIDLAALEDYLRFLYVPGPRTIFKSVRKLLPGYVLIARVDSGEITERPYWSFDISSNGDRTEIEAASELRRLLEDAVRVRLRSDVPIGAFLSGGLDSSAVVGLMARKMHPQRPLTFSMQFSERDFDESEFAALAATKFDTDQHVELVEPVRAETLQRISWHLDEPFADSSAVPTYLVCQAARRHVTVALSGDGGDELFAGYNRYRHYRFIKRLASWPLPVRRWASDLMSAGVRRWVGSVPYAVGERARQAAKALEASCLPGSRRPFFLNQYFEPAAIRQLMSSETRASANGRTFEDEWSRLLPRKPIDGLDLFLYMDTVLGLPDDMLTKVDRMSMAHGLEVRCPILDHKVVEYAGSIPTDLKLRGQQSKYIFRKAVADLIPAPILHRPKSGFDAPIGQWLAGPFRELTEECLSAEASARRGWFSPDGVASIRDRVLKPEVANGASSVSKHQIWHRAWALLMLELWARNFLDAAAAA